MSVESIEVARAARRQMVPSGAVERPRGVGPVPVVDDVNAMLVRLAQEHRRVLNGGFCCLVICQPDENDRIPRALGLKECALRFAETMRSYDGIFHYGDHKLLLCMPHVLSKEAAGAMARLRKLVCARPVTLANGEKSILTVTLSGAMMNRFSFVEDTVLQAERAIHSTLSAGGNRVCMLMPEA